MQTQPQPLFNQQRMPPLLDQFLDLFLMELTNWRWVWRRHILLNSTLPPLFMMVFFSFFAPTSDREAFVYILTGNMVFSLIFGTMHSVESRVEWLRFNGGLDYFATLPIQRAILALSMTAAFLLFSLPSIILTMVLGSLWLKLPITLNPILLLIIPLCATPLAGVGAIVGLTCRTRGEGGSIAMLLAFLLTGLGPVVVPPDRLPDFMILLGRLSPATYAASAFRQTVIGPMTNTIVLDLAVLGLMSLLSLWYVGYRLSWQVGT